MKKLIPALLLLVGMLLPMAVMADVVINDTNFPDENFRNYVLTLLRKNLNDTVSEAKFNGVTKIECYAKSIGSLEGIEYFTKLETLDCSFNQLTGLDVSKNTALTELNCSDNQLTKLDVSKNTALMMLYCSVNKLTELDVNTALTVLNCSTNQLTKLDVSANTKLKELECSKNQLTELNVNQNMELVGLACRNNQLACVNVNSTQLSVFYANNNIHPIYVSPGGVFDLSTLKGFEVSKASNWQGGKVSGNVLTVDENATQVTYTYDCGGNNQQVEFALILGVAINKTNFPDDNFRAYIVGKKYDKNDDGILSISEINAVTSINCGGEKIQSLKGIEYFTALKTLECYSNQLTELDVSKNTALETLECNTNYLTELDVSQNTALKELYCHFNHLTKLDVSQNTALVTLHCHYNKLTKLDIGKNTALEMLYCYENQLTELDVRGNTALKMLDCTKNQLTKLNIGKNTALKELHCEGNQLTELDVRECTALQNLYCGENQLTKLNIEKNTALEALHCDYNQLTELDVSRNTALTDLQCSDNALTELDVRKNTALKDLRCNENKLTELDVSRNTALMILLCSNNTLTELDLSTNTRLEELRCSENQLACVNANSKVLNDFNASRNTHTIFTGTDGVFDLSKLKGFDLKKASNWKGGTVSGSTLRISQGASRVTYTYDCGKGRKVTFTLKVNYLPQTGDNTHLALWIALLGGCSAALALMMRRRKA